MFVFKKKGGGGLYGLHIAFIVISVFFVTQYHVHETNKWENRMGYMQTLPCSPVLDGDYGVYAMDCEMVSDTFCKRSSPTLSLCFFHSCFKQTYLEIMCTLFGHVILIHWNIIMLCWTGLYSRWSGACSSHCDRQWKQLSIRDFSEARSENYWSQHQVTRLFFCPKIL